LNYQYPDRISTEGITDCEVSPKHAVLDIIVEGESIFFGNEALSKSKEILELINKLDSIGYSKDKITLESISIKTNTGKILKSSSATFNLLLNEIPMDLIPKLLGVVSIQKNIEITEINYEYGNLEIEKSQLLKEGSVKAKRQAEEICESLGVTLLGVYSMTQKWSNPFTDAISQNFSGGGFIEMSKSRSVQPQELEGMNFTTNHKSKLYLTLKLDFRVGEINA